MIDLSRGWIKLHRGIIGNKFWVDEPFTRGQAWVDLLLLANHEDGFIRVRGKRVDVKRGQVGWSQEKLAERWKWSRKKVSNFLSELEKTEQQIAQHKDNVSSLITITNYETYQAKEQQKEQQKHSKGTAEAQQKNTNKNEEEVKKEKKEPYGEFVKLTKSEYDSLVEDFGEALTTDKIQDLNDYVGSKGTKYASHNLTIRAWIRKDEKKKKDQDKTYHKFLN